MGGFVPAAAAAPWNPEDDILLKNAVEAGASLEALAKGAVQFSRRYTIRELQERWHSLLYDPIVSEDASMSMIDVERSSSILPSKFNKFGNPKETKCIGAKRKSGSVRCCYYALRKRICNEPFNPMDLSYLVGDNDFVEEEPMSGNCIPPLSDDFGLQSLEPVILPDNFAQNVMNNDDTGHTFHYGCQPAVEKHFPQNLDNGHNGISHLMVDKLPFSASKSEVMELATSSSFPVPSLFENDLEPTTFRQLSNDQIVMGSEPEENDVFNSPVSDSGTSFHNVEYSSPLPDMSIWKNTSPSLSIDVDFADKDIPIGDSFELPDDDGNENIQSARLTDFDAHSNFKMKIEVQHDHLKSPDVTAEGYLAELSNSLLNLNNEDELLFMDVDGQDVIDKTYYDGFSLLLSSPNEVTHDQTDNAINEEAVLPMDTMLDPLTACSGELYEKGSLYSDVHLDCSSEAHPSASISASFSGQCLGKGDEPLFCILNTEDLEIPSNDDVFLPPLSTTSTMGYHFRDCMNPTFSPVKDFSLQEKSSETAQSLVQRERKNHGQPRVSSLSIGLHGLPERGEKHLVGGTVVNLKSSHSSSIGMSSANKTSSINANNDVILPIVLKENNNEVSRELDTLTTMKEHRLSQEVSARGVFGEEPEGISSTSDQEELSIDSEDDVPHFSDIEAMILDMDLDPEDHDFYTNEEVLKYQHMETKKRIIRLEQGANAYMQRSIASHGALAALYGRHSKHYIKKAEVLLGRATADFIVDIDLGREGSGNKISRRQAIIKIDQDGFFYLKNLGKCSISVNNKDVAPGHGLRLNSGCLIEIRGMPFIFESNPVRMKQYVDFVGKTSHKQEYQS